jgi:hypothetical protein
MRAYCFNVGGLLDHKAPPTYVKITLHISRSLEWVFAVRSMLHYIDLEERGGGGGAAGGGGERGGGGR